jgi:hypothetical protein
MSSTTIECRACHRILTAGEALSVTPANGSPAFAVCRVGLSPRCFFRAGRRESAAIAEYNPGAAIAFDHLYRDDGPRANARGDREAAEVKHAFAANLAISARDARYEREEE